MRPSAHRRRMLAAVAVVLLLPGALYAAGVRSTTFENRQLASFPSLADGWDLFPRLEQWATDNLPLREQGVQAGSWVDRTIFGDRNGASPTAPGTPLGPVGEPPASASWQYAGYPQVVEGRDGILFYGGDFAQLCEPSRGVDEVIGAMRTLAAAVAQSGRRFLLVVPPDKSAVQPGALPDDPVGEQCRAERIAEVDASLEGVPVLSGLLPALRRMAEDSSKQVYLDKDSHWDGPAAAEMVRQVVAHLDRAVVPSLRARTYPAQSGTADLSVLLGSTSTVQYHPVTVASPSIRRAWTDVAALDGVPRRYVSTGPAGTLLGGRSVVLGDSFTLAARATLPGVFADLTELHVEAIHIDPQVVLDEIVGADTVLLEVVQREFYSGDSPVFDPDFLGALVSALAANPR